MTRLAELLKNKGQYSKGSQLRRKALIEICEELIQRINSRVVSENISPPDEAVALSPDSAKRQTQYQKEELPTYKGKFVGEFVGDGSQIKFVHWNNITGRKRSGAGGPVIVGQIPTASFAETASFALHSAGTTIVSGREEFITFFDPEPALAIIRNQPSGVYEPTPESRKQLDLSHFTEARISTQVITSGGFISAIGFQYSKDGGISWNFLNSIFGPIASLITTGSSNSSYVMLDEDARQDILIRWVSLYGDDVTSPVIGSIMLGLK